MNSINLSELIENNEHNTETPMPKSIWQLYWWLFFEPELVKKADVYSTQNPTPKYFRSIVLNHLLFCVFLWLSLTALSVLLYQTYLTNQIHIGTNFAQGYYYIIYNSSLMYFIISIYQLNYILPKGSRTNRQNYYIFAYISTQLLLFYSIITPFLTPIDKYLNFFVFSFMFLGIEETIKHKKYERNDYSYTKLINHFFVMMIFSFILSALFIVIFFVFDYIILHNSYMNTYEFIYPKNADSIFFYTLKIYPILISSYYLVYSRPFVIIYYKIRNFIKPYTLYYNPYYWDGYIFDLNKKFDNALIKQCYEYDTYAEMFLKYISNYRPNLEELSNKIKHAISAKKCELNPMNEDILQEYILSGEGVKAVINIPDEWKDIVSYWWLFYVNEIRKSLIYYKQSNNLSYKMDSLNHMRNGIEQWKKQNDSKLYYWYSYYTKAINAWQREVEKEIRQLEKQISLENPLGVNIYRTGVKLQTQDEEVFMGRQEIKARLQYEINNAPHVPMFFLQGQRRVGKSSFISFLQLYLGSGFVVVPIDFQERQFTDVQAWLSDMLQRTEKRFGIEATALPTKASWVSSFQAVAERLSALSATHQKRIILALDEYELLNKLLTANEEEAERLLGAMRGYAQAQNEVIFMFAGQIKMADLSLPWDKFFVQRQLISVPYLTQIDTNKLIEAYQSLTYAPEAKQLLFEQTQGHPALLQKILYEVVQQTNALHNDITGTGSTDRTHLHIEVPALEKAIQKAILGRENGVIDIFWKYFAQEIGYDVNPAILQIIENQPITDKKALIFLEDYEFIIPDAVGKYCFRVPLFETWLKKHANF